MIEDGVVVHDVDLAASPESVFAMFVDPAKLVSWIGISADLDPCPGGRFRFEVMPGQFCEGRYLEIERPRRLVFSWGWSDPAMGLPPGSSRVEVVLTETTGGTHLRLTHHQLPGDLRLLHDDGWSRFLTRLVVTAAGGEAGTYPVGDPAARLTELRGGSHLEVTKE